MWMEEDGGVCGWKRMEECVDGGGWWSVWMEKDGRVCGWRRMVECVNGRGW